MKDTLTMIRKFREEDTDAVVSSWRVATELAHPFLNKDFLDSEAIALRDIYLPATETWVTEIDENVIGFIAMMGNEIAGLFLIPSFHGQGFGRAMVDKAFKEKGSLTVEVFEQNPIGRRFYDAYGFQKFGEYAFEQTGDTVLQMQLNLT